jgi:hypothetical protein
MAQLPYIEPGQADPVTKGCSQGKHKTRHELIIG